MGDIMSIEDEFSKIKEKLNSVKDELENTEFPEDSGVNIGMSPMVDLSGMMSGLESLTKLGPTIANSIGTGVVIPGNILGKSFEASMENMGKHIETTIKQAMQTVEDVLGNLDFDWDD